LIKFSKSLYYTVWKFQTIYSHTFLTKISWKQCFFQKVIELISGNNFLMWVKFFVFLHCVPAGCFALPDWLGTKSNSSLCTSFQSWILTNELKSMHWVEFSTLFFYLDFTWIHKCSFWQICSFSDFPKWNL